MISRVWRRRNGQFTGTRVKLTGISTIRSPVSCGFFHPFFLYDVKLGENKHYLLIFYTSEYSTWIKPAELEHISLVTLRKKNGSKGATSNSVTKEKKIPDIIPRPRLPPPNRLRRKLFKLHKRYLSSYYLHLRAIYQMVYSHHF